MSDEKRQFTVTTTTITRETFTLSKKRLVAILREHGTLTGTGKVVVRLENEYGNEIDDDDDLYFETTTTTTEERVETPPPATHTRR